MKRPDGKRGFKAKAQKTRFHLNAVYSLAWSPDSSHITSGSDDGTIQIWNASTGERFLTCHQSYAQERVVLDDLSLS